MNWADVIVLALIAFCVVLSIIFIKRKKSCCGDCSCCGKSENCRDKIE